jgi:hypothetical protein
MQQFLEGRKDYPQEHTRPLVSGPRERMRVNPGLQECEEGS